MLLNDHSLLPRNCAPQNGVTFPWLKFFWMQFLLGTLLNPPLQRVTIARPEERGRQEAAVPVPPLFRALFVGEPATLPYYFLWNTFAHYVNSYPGEEQDQGQRGRFTMGDGVEQSVRRSHLMAFYWLLVVQPFQRVIAGHRNLFEGIDPAELTPPEDVGAVEGGGGGGGEDGPGGGGPDDDPGGAGGGGGHSSGGRPSPPNLPPSPPQQPLDLSFHRPSPPHPPPSPSQPLDLSFCRPRPAPAQPSSSSSSSFSGAISQQSQPGTCSASQPVSALAEGSGSGGNEGGTSSTSPDVKEAAEILLLLKRGGKSAAPDNRGGSPAPPPKKHKPEDFRKDPDGGAGAGGVAGQV